MITGVVPAPAICTRQRTWAGASSLMRKRVVYRPPFTSPLMLCFAPSTGESRPSTRREYCVPLDAFVVRPTTSVGGGTAFEPSSVAEQVVMVPPLTAKEVKVIGSATRSGAFGGLVTSPVPLMCMPATRLVVLAQVTDVPVADVQPVSAMREPLFTTQGLIDVGLPWLSKLPLVIGPAWAATMPINAVRQRRRVFISMAADCGRHRISTIHPREYWPKP